MQNIKLKIEVGYNNRGRSEAKLHMEARRLKSFCIGVVLTGSKAG